MAVNGLPDDRRQQQSDRIGVAGLVLEGKLADRLIEQGDGTLQVILGGMLWNRRDGEAGNRHIGQPGRLVIAWGVEQRAIGAKHRKLHQGIERRERPLPAPAQDVLHDVIGGAMCCGPFSPILTKFIFLPSRCLSAASFMGAM